MAIVPTSTAKKGEVVLQPAFFTSSFFVDPFKGDLGALTLTYHEAWQKEHEGGQPFTVFKHVWIDMGWPWMQFKTLEDRSRHQYLGVTMRLLFERASKTENAFSRITALFALYILYMTQPTIPAPFLRRRDWLSVPADAYVDLMELPATLGEPDMLPFHDQVVYIISRLLEADLFRIVPSTELHAQNPRTLPRELYVNEAMGVLVGRITEPGKQKKKLGRPSKRDQARRTRENTDALDRWLDQAVIPGAVESNPNEDTVPGSPLSETAKQYRDAKDALLDALLPSEHADAANEVSRDAVVSVNNRVLERLRRIDALAAEKGLEVGGAGGTRTGLTRVERAVKELGAGLVDGQ